MNLSPEWNIWGSHILIFLFVLAELRLIIPTLEWMAALRISSSGPLMFEMRNVRPGMISVLTRVPQGVDRGAKCRATPLLGFRQDSKSTLIFVLL